MRIVGYGLLGLAAWTGIVGAVVGWPLTLPIVFVLGILGIAAVTPPRRPYDWSRDS